VEQFAMRLTGIMHDLEVEQLADGVRELPEPLGDNAHELQHGLVLGDAISKVNKVNSNNVIGSI
jgi:hypothetical protein